MSKVMMINGVWTAIVCGMLTASVFLYTQNATMPDAYGYAQMASR